MMRFRCVACGTPAEDAYHAFCECGSLIDVEYDLARVRLAASANPYVRFADLRPIASTRDRLPHDARFSPTIRAKALGAQLGLDSLYLKEMAKKIISRGPLAVRGSLEAIMSGSEMPFAEGQFLEATLFGLLCSSEDQ